MYFIVKVWNGFIDIKIFGYLLKKLKKNLLFLKLGNKYIFIDVCIFV